MNDADSELFDLLAEHEWALKALYEYFTDCFPEKRDFWNNISLDEERHAHWLVKLKADAAMAGWSVAEGGLRAQAVRSSIAHVEEQHERAKAGSMTLVQALAVAKDLEAALIEKQFSRMAGDVPAEMREVLHDLVAECERHRQSIIDELEIARAR